MNMDRPKLWIAFFSLLAVLSVAVVDRGRTSPGPLAGAHGALPELAGSSSCSECHGGWRTSMTMACLDCHAPIAAQLEQDEGLHGLLDETAVARCAACHSDHHGSEFQLVGPQSFKKAGFDGRDGFDHGFIGFAMAGKHLELDCAECHENAEVTVLPEGHHRFLGEDQDCSTCHEDPHEGAMRLDCTECHSQQGFEEQHSRGHADHLELIGGHAGISCRECHGADGLHALEKLVRPGRKPEARACADCHESPHNPNRLKGLSGLEGTRPDASCSVCHELEHERFDEPGLAVNDRQHKALGFPLGAPHDGLECAACHDPQLGAFEDRHPGRAPADCHSCHQDPHGGQFDDVLATGEPFGASGCTACHEPDRFEPHGFDLDRHGRTALPLLATHAELECSACHERETPEGPRRFDGVPSDCDACHQDAHQGFFSPYLEGLEPVAHGDCARCHEPTHFDEPSPGGFDHGAHTPFPLVGAHEQGECATCHEPLPEPDSSTRTFGFACDPLGSHSGCMDCHNDPHEGIFDRGPLHDEFEGRVSCERCHDQSSFRSLPHGFNHQFWTGFPLAGAHAEASCSQCHAPMRPTEPGGRTWLPAAGTECAACHTDPHAAQFEVAGTTSCSTCHQSTDHFSTLAFDHDKQSRFPLEGAHREVGCAECHEPELIDGQSVIRYKPLGTDCTDCHTIQPGSLRSQLGAGR